MDATYTHPTHSDPTAQQIVREYPSSQLFHQDAQALYAHTGYTVTRTAGRPHHGLTGFLFFVSRRPEHLVITYARPTNPGPR
jgi:hypothetical protein